MKKLLLCLSALTATATLASCSDTTTSATFKEALEASVTQAIQPEYKPQLTKQETELSNSITPESKTLIEQHFSYTAHLINVEKDKELKSTVKTAIDQNETFTAKIKTDLGVTKDKTINYTYKTQNKLGEDIWLSTYTVFKDNETAKSLTDLSFKDTFKAESVYIYYIESKKGELTEGLAGHYLYEGKDGKVNFGPTNSYGTTITDEGNSLKITSTTKVEGLDSYSKISKDFKSIEKYLNNTTQGVESKINFKKLETKYEGSVKETKKGTTVEGTGTFSVSVSSEGTLTFTWDE